EHCCAALGSLRFTANPVSRYEKGSLIGLGWNYGETANSGKAAGRAARAGRFLPDMHPARKHNIILNIDKALIIY
ncbi:MAG: hypothetical protein ACYC5N_00845, partial [Endomicrobiales bacterium]